MEKRTCPEWLNNKDKWPEENYNSKRSNEVKKRQKLLNS